jgi:hypothetical protein
MGESIIVRYVEKKFKLFTNKMQHLASILLVLAALVSSIAISLPIWASHDDKKQTDKSSGGTSQTHQSIGLFGACASMKTDPKKGDESNIVMCGQYMKDGMKVLSEPSTVLKTPKDMVVSQVLAIVGAVLALGGGVLCMSGRRTGSKIAGVLALGCMIAVLVVFPVVSLDDENKMQKTRGGPKMNLSVSYWMQLAAAILVLGGLVSCFMGGKKGGKKSGKKSRRN